MSVTDKRASALTVLTDGGLFLSYGALQVPRLKSRVSKAVDERTKESGRGMTRDVRGGEMKKATLGRAAPSAEAAALGWVDILPQAVLLYRREVQTGALVVTRMNACACELWNVPESRALGRPLLEVVRRHTLEALAARGGELELEVGGRTMRCRAWLDTASAPPTKGDSHSDNDRKQGAAELSGALVLEDISEHRRREAELREATAVLSHEFRTPVTAIRGILEALEYEMPPELQQNFVSQGLQEAERLARLVEDLAVGFRPTRARTLALSEAFQRAERLLNAEYHMAPAGSPSGRLIFGEDHLVRADPDKLLQVLLNLIENALKYGPEGETVEVQTRASDAWVEVAVLNKGAPLADTESLFRAHTRGRHATGQGSGMGLYIVRSIVQGWGGRAWAERRGAANAFCFTVPSVG